MLEIEEATHGSGEHVAAVSVPELHEDVPDTVYPELHEGWHVDPLPREIVHVPTPPFVGGAEASHGFAEHVAAVSVPELHEDVPDTVYPELHEGWHVDPLPREIVHVPTPPFVGGAEASHGFAEHVAAVANSERTTRNIREVDEDLCRGRGQERPIFFSTNRSPILDLKYLCRANIGSNTPMRPHDRH